LSTYVTSKIRKWLTIFKCCECYKVVYWDRYAAWPGLSPT
jgi:hypothetical protein